MDISVDLSDVKVIKIWAIGSNQRFAWFKFVDDEVICLRVSDYFYWKCRKCGVPTSQKLRYEKD